MDVYDEVDRRENEESKDIIALYKLFPKMNRLAPENNSTLFIILKFYM